MVLNIADRIQSMDGLISLEDEAYAESARQDAAGRKAEEARPKRETAEKAAAERKSKSETAEKEKKAKACHYNFTCCRDRDSGTCPPEVYI